MGDLFDTLFEDPDDAMYEKSRELLEAIQANDSEQAGRLIRETSPAMFAERYEVLLAAALFSTDGIFRGVWSMNPTAKDCVLTIRHPREVNHVLEGSAVMLAAAVNDVPKLRYLIQHGGDCNDAYFAGKIDRAASDDIQSRFEEPNYSNLPDRFCASPQNQVVYHLDAYPESRRIASLRKLTPLAAAVLFDSREAAELLLRQPGVWKTESTAVCQAIAVREHAELSLHCARSVLEAVSGEDGSVSTEQLLREVRLEPLAVADYGSCRLLQLQYESGLYTPDDIRALLRRFEFDNGILTWQTKKLLLTGDFFPEICREDEMKAVFFNAWLQNPQEEQLFERFCALCGGSFDLTWSMEMLGLFGPRNSLPAIKRLLQAGIALRVDEDALAGADTKLLALLLRSVTLVPNRREKGIGGLAVSLLWNVKDQRLIRQAMKKKLLEGEPAEELLAYNRQHGDDRFVRAAILSGKLGGGERADAELCPPDDERLPCLSTLWCRELCGEGRDSFIARLFSADYSEDMLRDAVQYRLYRSLFIDDNAEMDTIAFWHPRWGKYLTREPMLAACCGAGVGPAAVLRFQKADRLQYRISDMLPIGGRQLNLNGSLLCWAAAAGKTEKVRQLPAAPSAR